MKTLINRPLLPRTLCVVFTLGIAMLCSSIAAAKVTGTHSGGKCTVTDGAGVTASIGCGSGVSQATCNSDGSCSVGALAGPVGGGSGNIATATATQPELAATKNIPRCTSVRRDLVNKPGLPAVAINKASQSDLIQVPGISASTAQKIIAERAKREFSDWDDVLRRVDSMRCIDFTGSPLQVMSRPFDAKKGLNPKNPGF